jgi:L-amino acid N-acyltransferase YncA
VIQIRKARALDIEGIADVVKDVWEQQILPDVCEAQIVGASSALWVATDDADEYPAGERHAGAVIGFVSAFLTADAWGHRRWEVDLVAVRQDGQGQGLGTQMISRVCKAGESNGISLARALIRAENTASQRAFRNAGFTTDGQLHHLLLWSPKPGAVSMPRIEGIILLSAETLTYRGLWIDGLENVTPNEQRSVVAAARAMIARDRRLNTGAVIPQDREHHLAVDVRSEASIHGEYLWFVKPHSRT